MELGETTEETAKREILEETNLRIENLNLLNVYSGKENFIKAPNGDEFYVVVIAYYTKHISGEMIINREESQDFKFFPLDEIPENLAKSHKTIINEFISKFSN